MHADAARVRRARGDPGRDGGGLRRPDALHVQPGRRAQGRTCRPAGWDARTQRDRRRACRRRRDIAPLDPRQRDLPRPRPRGRRTRRRRSPTAYGVSGPIARASGLDLDLRRDDPYLAYAELPAPTSCGSSRGPRATAWRASSACSSRSTSRSTSPSTASACSRARARADQRPAAEGRQGAGGRRPTPGPRTRSGINGYYLVSRGERTPWRLKLRTASFNNVQVLAAAAAGQPVGDLVAILG